MKRVVNICEEGGCCPQVVFDDIAVKIGEAGNICTLTPDQWASLRKKVLSGEL